MRALIEAGASLEKVDMTHSATALMHAARTGSPEKINILLEAGANLEARDATGKTPLLIAADASGATTDMVQTLIDAGADIQAKDNRGQTALDLARKRTDPRGGEVLALFEKLLGEGEE